MNIHEAAELIVSIAVEYLNGHLKQIKYYYYRNPLMVSN
jgi:hypothetical protein